MSEINQTTQNPPSESKYPVSSQFKVLEGYDIYRSSRLIVALVVVESNFGRDLRMYRWQLRNDSWKVDLCRMSVGSWKWNELSTKAQELIRRYNIKRGESKAENTD